MACGPIVNCCNCGAYLCQPASQPARDISTLNTDFNDFSLINIEIENLFLITLTIDFIYFNYLILCVLSSFVFIVFVFVVIIANECLYL